MLINHWIWFNQSINFHKSIRSKLSIIKSYSHLFDVYFCLGSYNDSVELISHESQLFSGFLFFLFQSLPKNIIVFVAFFVFLCIFFWKKNYFTLWNVLFLSVFGAFTIIISRIRFSTSFGFLLQFSTCIFIATS